MPGPASWGRSLLRDVSHRSLIKCKQPISHRYFTLSLALGFLVGVALYSALTFLPVYQQSVHNFSATASGLLLPLLGGMLVGSTWSGPVISKKQAYRSILGGGSLALVVGCVLLGQLGSGTSTFAASIYMIVFGFGLVFQNVMVVAQNAVELKDMASASGALTYFRNVGGSFGVSLFAAVFGSRLNSYLSDRLSGSDRSVLTRKRPVGLRHAEDVLLLGARHLRHRGRTWRPGRVSLRHPDLRVRADPVPAAQAQEGRCAARRAGPGGAPGG